jgi:hypothetical protein
MNQLSFFRMRKPPPPLEFKLHCAVADLIRVSLKPGWIAFHCPNGEGRDRVTGARLKRMLVLPGVSDFILIAPPDGIVHALELKRGGLKPTPEQLDFLHQVKAAGGKANWANSFDGAVQILKTWGAVRVAG